MVPKLCIDNYIKIVGGSSMIYEHKYFITLMLSLYLSDLNIQLYCKHTHMYQF